MAKRIDGQRGSPRDEPPRNSRNRVAPADDSVSDDCGPLPVVRDGRMHLAPTINSFGRARA